MNYYFFLNHFDKSLNSSLDIFNFPPNNKFCKDIIRDIYPYAFYSTGKEWKIYQFNKIKKMKQFLFVKMIYLMIFIMNLCLYLSRFYQIVLQKV